MAPASAIATNMVTPASAIATNMVANTSLYLPSSLSADESNQLTFKQH